MDEDLLQGLGDFEIKTYAEALKEPAQTGKWADAAP